MLETVLITTAFLICSVSLIASLLIGASVITLFIVRVPFVPTPKKHVKKIIDLYGLKPGQKFYDLGCGEGRFIVEASKRGAKATGFELAPWPFARAKANIFLNHSSAKILLGDS